jgi:hypothetical protein
MNPKKYPEITVDDLLVLRLESDPLRAITESLRVKEMGPSDHIRTKHEAKAFVESGDLKAGEALILQALERREQHQAESLRQTQIQRQQIAP